MNSIKIFLGRHKTAVFFVLIFLVGFAFGWLVQIDRVYRNCVKWTDNNPACAMYKNYF